MEKKQLVIAGIALLAVGSLIAVSFANRKAENNQSSSASIELRQTAPLSNQHSVSQDTIPVSPLFSGVARQEITFDSSKSYDFLLTYGDFKYSRDPLKEVKHVQLPGRLWVTTIENLSSEQMIEIDEQFREYYGENSLLASGWEWEKDLDERKLSFSGPAADGPISSIWGYINVKNDILRLIGFSMRIADYIDISNGGPIDYECPCTLELQVFVSNEVSVNDFTI